VDRQLERAVGALRSVRIYKEREAGLNAAKTTAEAKPPSDSTPAGVTR
jgi:hypothetical protein